MKPIRSSILTLATLVSSVTLGVAQASVTLPPSIAKSKTLRICSAINLPPMEFMSPQTQPEGVDIDLAKGIAKKLGVKTKFINIPFAGLIPALLADHCDVIMSQLFIKKSRLKVIDEIPYMYSHESVLIKPGSPKVPDLEALSGKKVATVTGTTATVLLDAANKKLKAAKKKPINLVLFPENTQALQQLQLGQVAAYGVAYETARYYIKHVPGQFAMGGPPYFKIATGIGMRKDETVLNHAITTALDKMKSDGEYQAIFKKWDLQLDMLKR